MNILPSYRKALYAAITLHFLLALLLFTESTSQRPVLTMEAKNTPGVEQHHSPESQPEIVKAVSVNSQEVMETVNRLKQERIQQRQAEINRQTIATRQLEQARQQKIKEQQEVVRLKQEANKIAIAHKKQAEEDKKRLKELAEQKKQETKNIEQLKRDKEKLMKQEKLAEKRLEELDKKKLAEKAREEQLKIAQEKAAKAEQERKKQAEAATAAREAENQARISGEVNKYKALIVNAISRNWILPDHADSTLSSKFRIRLAPDGTVLEVSLIRSSGDTLLDRSAQTAIYKASPLPVPSDADTFSLFRDISLTVRPEQVRG